jgi:hypothetical protein
VFALSLGKKHGGCSGAIRAAGYVFEGILMSAMKFLVQKEPSIKKFRKKDGL